MPPPQGLTKIKRMAQFAAFCIIWKKIPSGQAPKPPYFANFLCIFCTRRCWPPPMRTSGATCVWKHFSLHSVGAVFSSPKSNVRSLEHWSTGTDHHSYSWKLCFIFFILVELYIWQHDWHYVLIPYTFLRTCQRSVVKSDILCVFEIWASSFPAECRKCHSEKSYV